MRIFDISKTAHTPRIRLINLVDILFILLIFFIATSTFRNEPPSAVKLSLPEAKTAEEVGREKLDHVLIHLAPDETLYLNETPITIDTLEGRLLTAKQKNADVTVEIKADKSVSYGRLMQVIDAARAAKISNLVAFTQPKPTTATPE
jgi:biopolymer transport protein ExbD